MRLKIIWIIVFITLIILTSKLAYCQDVKPPSIDKIVNWNPDANRTVVISYKDGREFLYPIVYMKAVKPSPVSEKDGVWLFRSGGMLATDYGVSTVPIMWRSGPRDEWQSVIKKTY